MKQEFFFLDVVKIKDGFYKEFTGIVVKKHIYSNSTKITYFVKLDLVSLGSNDIDIVEIDVNNLTLIKRQKQ